LKKDACGANATAVVKRTDFNMGKYAPDVGYDVTLTIAVEAVKKTFRQNLRLTSFRSKTAR